MSDTDDINGNRVSFPAVLREAMGADAGVYRLANDVLRNFGISPGPRFVSLLNDAAAEAIAQVRVYTYPGDREEIADEVADGAIPDYTRDVAALVADTPGLLVIEPEYGPATDRSGPEGMIAGTIWEAARGAAEYAFLLAEEGA